MIRICWHPKLAVKLGIAGECKASGSETPTASLIAHVSLINHHISTSITSSIKRLVTSDHQGISTPEITESCFSEGARCR